MNKKTRRFVWYLIVLIFFIDATYDSLLSIELNIDKIRNYISLVFYILIIFLYLNKIEKTLK